MKISRTVYIPVLLLAVATGVGFSFAPESNNNGRVSVETRVVTIDGHQYAMAVSTTYSGSYTVSGSSISMVHHAGCTACRDTDQQAEKHRLDPSPRHRYIPPRPPIAQPYKGQF